MISFTVCDDMKTSRKNLCDHIERYCSDNGIDFRINQYSSGEELLSSFPEETDILFLDIQMNQLNGIETAKVIRTQYPDLCIIFVTTFQNYALQSYEVRSLGFLTKPVKYDVFRNEMDFAISHLDRSKVRHKVVKERLSGDMVTLPINDVLYFEVRNHDVIANLRDRDVVFYGKISDMEKELEGCGFLRCHNSFLVNYRHIVRIDDSVHMSNGSNVPISRPRKKDFMQELTRFVGSLM